MAKGCRHCGIALTELTSNTSTIKRGYGLCKSCRKIDDNANRVQIRLRNREHYYKNRDRLLAQRYEIESKNKERYKLKRREYQERHKERLSNQSKDYNRSLNGRYKVLRRLLKLDNIPETDLLWNFNFYSALIQDLQCHYCLGSVNETGGALDRIINDIKHVCYNVVPCCRLCNRIKGNDISYEEMMVLAPALRDIRAKRHLMSFAEEREDSTNKLTRENDAIASF